MRPRASPPRQPAAPAAPAAPRCSTEAARQRGKGAHCVTSSQQVRTESGQSQDRVRTESGPSQDDCVAISMRWPITSGNCPMKTDSCKVRNCESGPSQDGNCPMKTTSQRIAVSSQGLGIARDPPTRWPPPPHFYFDTLTGRSAVFFQPGQQAASKFFSAKFFADCWCRGQDVGF